MSFKKLLVLIVASLLVLSSINAWATEEGENKFRLSWSSQKVDFPAGIPYTLWDSKTLPDYNNNGKNELFCAADDPVGGAWYFVVEATANDEYEVVWYYFIENCVYSYVLFGTQENASPLADLDADGLPELIAGVQQTAGSGYAGLWIWEKDTTITDAYPFPMDMPTCTYDVNGNGGGITMVFAGQLDGDIQTELVIGETHDDVVWVVEETSGDLAFPTFEVEYTDTLVYTPWGYYFGDLDNDGMKDFGVGTTDFNGIRLYENSGVEDDYIKHFELHLDDDVDGYCLRGMGARDINGDSRGEIIYVRNDAPGKVYLVTNPGEIALIDSNHVHELYVNPEGFSLSGVAYGDMDHGFGSDGSDIYFIASSNKIIDLEYTGPVGETVPNEALADPANWQTYELYTNANQDMQHLSISDFDRDGEGEVAIVYAGSGDENYVQIIEHEMLPDAGFEVMWHDDSTSVLTVDPVHSNPRGIFAGSDVDQDGKPEIMCTEYEGIFHVYEVVADNTVEWVFSYKTPHAPASGSQPRGIGVSDMDGNGKQEIIVHMGALAAGLTAKPDSIGFYFFEWDGVTDNGFGISGGPTYILPATEIDPRLTRTERTEDVYFDDVDNDGHIEALWPCNAGANAGDGLYIFSCVDGELTGFPTWKVELALHRGSGEMTGSPQIAITADLNGNGQKEAIFATWNNGQINFYEATAPDTYEETIVFTDITLTDETVYRGIGVTDIDGNGDDELVFNSYWNATIYIINAPDSIKNINIANPDHYAWLRDDAGGSGLTGCLADQNQNELPEFYVTLYTRGAVRALEYNGSGADMMAQESWTMKEVYVDRDFMYGNKYSIGVVSAVHGSFGVYAPNGDLDGDGKKEVVVSMIESPYSDTWLYVFEHTGSDGVSEETWKVITPSDYKLAQNYPNPFNPITTIEYTIPLDKRVTVKIYNMMGQEVRTLVNDQFQPQGTHKVVWDGTNNLGKAVATGTYMYSLEVGNVKQTKRMTLVK
ncbi:MAG: FG-GAP-like repeat-containing protein [Candidatus Zhuqueibacterota bacterium]